MFLFGYGAPLSLFLSLGHTSLAPVRRANRQRFEMFAPLWGWGSFAHRRQGEERSLCERVCGGEVRRSDWRPLPRRGFFLGNGACRAKRTAETVRATYASIYARSRSRLQTRRGRTPSASRKAVVIEARECVLEVSSFAARVAYC